MPTATKSGQPRTPAEELYLLSQLHGLVGQSEPQLQSAYQGAVVVQQLAQRVADLVDASERPGGDDTRVLTDDEWQALVELCDALGDLNSDHTEQFHRAWRAAYNANGVLDDAVTRLIEEIGKEADDGR